MKVYVLKVIRFNDPERIEKGRDQMNLGVYRTKSKAISAYDKYEKALVEAMIKDGNNKWISYELDCLSYVVEEFFLA